MRINNNLAAMNTWRHLSVSSDNMQKSLERLSSGNRINRAADDAAGLAVSEKMRSQTRGLNQAVRNAQDGIGLLQTAEGGAGVIQDMLQRMRELANQASTGTLQASDRSQLDQEFQQLKTQVDYIQGNTQFNGQSLLNGGLGSTVSNTGTNLTVANGIQNITSIGAAAGAGLTISNVAATHKLTIGYTDAAGVAQTETIDYGAAPTGFDTKTLNFTKAGISVQINSGLTADLNANNTFDVTAGSATLQIGANAGQTMAISIADLGTGASALNITGLDLTNAANASTAMGRLDTAIGKVSTERAKIGAYQNGLEYTVSNLQSTAENLTAAESRIRDVDMAAEMAQFTKFQVLQQAGTAMLAQANQLPQGVMSLLRG